MHYPPTAAMLERTESSSVTSTLLLTLHTLLRDEHRRRSFNQYQLSRVNLLEHLLLACQVITLRRVLELMIAVL